MKTVKFAGLTISVDDFGNVTATTENGDVVGTDTVADVLISVEALHALLRYAAIGEDGF